MDAGPEEDAGPEPDAGPRGPIPPRARTYEAFEHGVASGDPLTDAVILWTHVTTGETPSTDPVELTWEVASDTAFADVVQSGVGMAGPDTGFTYKVDVTGLSAGTTYYYRFMALGDTSPIGRTRTAPDGPVSRLRFAVCSCASLAHGWFHGYQRIADRTDLDAVLHLGDYIYEYKTFGSLAPGDAYGDHRAYLPDHEILTLEDYRTRYAQYRREPQLQAAHRQHPFICTWDDHETANNSYRGGAGNHDPETEGSWTDRLTAAYQAYMEWMPLRDQGEELKIWRAIRYGDLADIILPDTRIWARSPEGDSLDDPRIREMSHTLLGADQEMWLRDRLRTSSSRWKVLAQQVMMGQGPFPNTDQWDGYPLARERLLGAIRDDGVEDVLVLTGDIHSSWAMDITADPFDEGLYNPATGEGSLAVEFVVPGITSPGFPEELAELIHDGYLEPPHIHWINLFQRGYMILDLDETRAQGDWWLLEDIRAPMGTPEALGAAMATEVGANHLVEQPGATTPPPGTPDPAP
jgi:alkaline phosphatase D